MIIACIVGIYLIHLHFDKKKTLATVKADEKIIDEAVIKEYKHKYPDAKVKKVTIDYNSVFHNQVDGIDFQGSINGDPNSLYSMHMIKEDNENKGEKQYDFNANIRD